jgi:hypothetical protein
VVSSVTAEVIVIKSQRIQLVEVIIINGRNERISRFEFAEDSEGICKRMECHEKCFEEFFI